MKRTISRRVSDKTHAKNVVSSCRSRIGAHRILCRAPGSAKEVLVRWKPSMGDPNHRRALPGRDIVPSHRGPKPKFVPNRQEVVMKAKMKPAMVALTLTLGVCLLFPSVASAQKGMPCTPDPVDMFIMYGNLITCSIDQPGISDLYRFNGTAGQRIIIDASSGTTYPCIELVGVTTACAYYGSYREWIDTVLPTTQEYTIRIYDWSSSGTGNYTLDLESVVPPSPNGRQTAYGKYLTDQINPAGDIEPVFFFTASVGDVVDILADSSTMYPCIFLYAPDTTTTWNACAYYGSYSEEIRTSPLTLAGTYTILVYGWSPSGAGGYSLDLNCLGGPCVVTPIPDVSGYATFQGAPLVHAGVSLTQPGAPSPQLTRTDNNGYYQFLHIITGQSYTVMIHGQGDLDTPESGDAKPADRVDENPLH